MQQQNWPFRNMLVGDVEIFPWQVAKVAQVRAHAYAWWMKKRSGADVQFKSKRLPDRSGVRIWRVR